MLRSVLAVIFLTVSSAAALAADAPDLSALVGKKVDIQLHSGKQVAAAEVTKVVPGSRWS